MKKGRDYKQFQLVDGDTKAAPLTSTSSSMHFFVPAWTDVRLLEACPYKSSSCSPPTFWPKGDDPMAVGRYYHGGTHEHTAY